MPGSYVHRRPWGQQKPPLGYGIDLSSPFAEGLIGCWLFNEGAGLITELVNKCMSLYSSNVLWTPSNYGLTALNARHTGLSVPQMSKGGQYSDAFTAIVKVVPNTISSNYHPTCFQKFHWTSFEVNGGWGIYYDHGFSCFSFNVANGTEYKLHSLITPTLGKAYILYLVYDKTFMVGQVVDAKGNSVYTDSQSATWGDSPLSDVTFGNTLNGLNAQVVWAYFYNHYKLRAQRMEFVNNPYSMIEGYDFGRYFSIASGKVL